MVSRKVLPRAGPPRGVSGRLWQEMIKEADRLVSTGLVETMESSGPSVGQFSEIGFDLSRNLVSPRAHELLKEFAQARQAPKFWSDMAAGRVVNTSENRAASHMQWRNPRHESGESDRMASVVERYGPGGKHSEQITDVIGVGIGGSDLGPALLASVARAYTSTKRRFHCLSALSTRDLTELLDSLKLSQTLVVMASKSFNTAETIAIGSVLKDQYELAGVVDWQQHFFGVTAEPNRAIQWGLLPAHVVNIGEDVGGRYSVGSAISLGVCLTYGLDPLVAFRQGLFVLDEAVGANPADSLPMQHALIWYWYRVFLGLQSVAVVAYMPGWRGLTGYLQQLIMESLGKSHTVGGGPVTTPVGSVVIGESGSNAQHSFMQYLQMGTTAVPADLLAPLTTNCPKSFGDTFDDFQLTNAYAQAQCLALGANESISPSPSDGFDQARHSRGGRPSNIFVLPDDGPFSLGQVLSMYEHSTIFQAALYDVNPFDQWGVEAGKELAQRLDGRFPRVSLQVALEFFRDGITGGFRS